ncbi:GNAT family N-acetyltransferase [Pedobacter antarcticus]|uniref:GNAT family N-acetyltransferase n=1 Tax=Pedobacter antarcticus TaxID=34086 RepID=UPI00292F7EDF|nr:GNAT family N-acetyltransferase [Pedobacter antarcticus]
MTKLQNKDTKQGVRILANAFEHNLSVNHIVKQDHLRSQRLIALMNYTFKVCGAYGKVFISADGCACALVMLPDKKKVSMKMLFWDLKLIVNVIGIDHLFKVLKRETLIRQSRPFMEMYYLWFIGVHPLAQHRGRGTELLEALIADARAMKRPIFLETSVLKNVPWYEKFGFRIYHEINLGYKLYFMKMDT